MIDGEFEITEKACLSIELMGPILQVHAREF
jgi:hypothetical protein